MITRPLPRKVDGVLVDVVDLKVTDLEQRAENGSLEGTAAGNGLVKVETLAEVLTKELDDLILKKKKGPINA